MLQYFSPACCSSAKWQGKGAAQRCLQARPSDAQFGKALKTFVQIIPLIWIGDSARKGFVDQTDNSFLLLVRLGIWEDQPVFILQMLLRFAQAEKETYPKKKKRFMICLVSWMDQPNQN